ncbi:MAG: peptidylprolyl isomerase [Bdellovibrionaceae bacterium]|nr:peptidylprolyl isomerase [Pseudobdellovibrionaceae bacterium]
MMRNFVALAFVVTMAAPAFAQDKGQDQIVATVGEKKISLKEFNEKYEEVLKQTINPPPRELFLEDLVRYEMGVQEANKRQMESDPIVKERIRQEMYKGLIERELGKKISEIKVNEDEMKAYYNKNPEIRTSHILIEFKPDATQEQKAAAKSRASELYDEVKKSKRPFEELVGLYSDDVLTKKNGGDVGWQSGMTLVPNYYQAILKMKVGEVKGLIETQYGFHIVKVTGRRGYTDANKRQIRAAVFDEKRKDLFDSYFAKLRKQYKIDMNKTAVR